MHAASGIYDVPPSELRNAYTLDIRMFVTYGVGIARFRSTFQLQSIYCSLALYHSYDDIAFSRVLSKKEVKQASSILLK